MRRGLSSAEERALPPFQLQKYIYPILLFGTLFSVLSSYRALLPYKAFASLIVLIQLATLGEPYLARYAREEKSANKFAFT